MSTEITDKIDASLVTELDWQIYKLQRKYLDYQVNIGNRMIQALQKATPEAAEEAQRISQPKRKFQDLIDDLFSETGKKIVRTENEIRFEQIGETLMPYQLSSGEKQMLVILLTVLIEDGAKLRALHGRARGESPRRMAEAAHRPDTRTQLQCTDHPHHP